MAGRLENRKGSPLLIVPGTLFWVLIGVGATTGNDVLIGAAVVLAVVTIVGVLATRVRASGKAKAVRDAVWATGTAATAKVLTLDGTGARINHSPEVAIGLEVTAPGRPPYPATVTTYISDLAIPRVQPGCTLDVRVDPADPTIVVLDPSLR